MKKQIIYHENCHDGFCAAWLCHLVWPDAEFIAANYGHQPPDVTGNDVLILDFSWPRDAMLDMASKATKISLLDHHETARKNLDGLDFCTIDTTKSGARLTWEYLINNELLNPCRYWPGYSRFYQPKVHWLVLYIEDFDLYKFELPHSREVTAAIRSYPLDFAYFAALSQRSVESLRPAGEALLRQQQLFIDHHLKHAQLISINGINGVGCECSVPKLVSSIGEQLLDRFPEAEFAAMWADGPEARYYSLRSRKGGFDVGKLAESLGGGGHPSASAIKVLVQHNTPDTIRHNGVADVQSDKNARP